MTNIPKKTTEEWREKLRRLPQLYKASEGDIIAIESFISKELEKERDIKIGFNECADCGRKNTELKACICTITGGLFSPEGTKISTQIYCQDCLGKENHKHEGQAFC